MSRGAGEPERPIATDRLSGMTAVLSLVFYLDGTLYFDDRLGREITRTANRYIALLKGVDDRSAAELIRATRTRLQAEQGLEATLSQACTELGGDLRELHSFFNREIAPEPLLTRDERVVNLLEQLGRQFSLYIYTNNNRDLAARIMAALGVSHLFRRVFTIEESWRPKPDRQMLKELLNEIGREPSECLFVGDRYDIDLRLPEEVGARAWPVSGIEDLMALNTLLSEGNND